MDSINEKSIYGYIEKNFSEKRKIHTEGVRKTAMELAGIYGADREKAETAALFHDMFRGRTVDELDGYVKEFRLPEKFLGNANVSHGKIAAAVMERDWGIRDRDVLAAVRYHTTGRAGMSLLERIVFIADAVEPSRDYPGVEELREKAFKDLDEACLDSLDGTLKHLREQGIAAGDDTEAAAEWIRRKIKEERNHLMNSKETALFGAEVLDDKNGGDIVIIDISEKSSFADYFLLASGNSERQIGALADEIEDRYAEKDLLPKGIEGKKESGWILMDYGDLIVNILTRDMREKYNIERVWGDCETIRLEEQK